MESNGRWRMGLIKSMNNVLYTAIDTGIVPFWIQDSTSPINNTITTNNAKGKLMVDGTDVLERIKKIEDHLGIIQHNTALEERWAQLKKLGDDYRKMEKDLLEKEQIYNILGGS